MVQFQILSGRMAGSRPVARRFPFWIGRGATAPLRLEDPGVWERHVEINFQRGIGFELAAQGDALVSVNGERQTAVRLRNGDLIELGGTRLRFWLGDAEQKELGTREFFTWMLVALVAVGQIALVYWLLR